MIRISSKKHETTPDGVRVYIEGMSQLALTSPEAQRLVFNYAKSAGLDNYGLNKYVATPEDMHNGEVFSQSGYWVLMPSQWNQNVVRV
jgi:hypothetical protein